MRSISYQGLPYSSHVRVQCAKLNKVHTAYCGPALQDPLPRPAFSLFFSFLFFFISPSVKASSFAPPASTLGATSLGGVRPPFFFGRAEWSHEKETLFSARRG
jgi:hypothetical protein